MADRYWWPSGGTGSSTGTWASATNWSSSSAAYISAAAPTSSDTANFGSYSGGSAFTVTISAAAVCTDLVINNSFMTLAGNSALDIYGNVSVLAFATRTYTGTLSFFPATAKVISFGAMTLQSTVFVYGSITLGSAFSTTAAITVYGGTFDTSSTGNYSVTASSLGIGSGTKTIRLNASYIYVGGSSIAFGVWGGLTLFAGTSEVIATGSSSFNSGGYTLYNVTFNNIGTTLTINGTGVFNNLSFGAKTTVGNNFVNFTANQTINGALTVSPPTTIGASRYTLQSDSIGTARTISAGSVSLVDCDFRDITGSGAATWAGTRLGDCRGNSGITFPAAKTVYWNLAGNQSWSATGWATTSGGIPANANFPLAQDTAIFTDTNPAASATVTYNAAYNIGTIDFSARTLALTWGVSSGPTVYGDTVLSTAITPTTSSTISYAGRGNTQYIMSAGRTWAQALSVQNIGGTVRLVGACVRSNSASLVHGTLDLNGSNLTCTTLASSNSNTRTIAFGALGGQITGTSTGGVWNTSTTTGLTITGTDPRVYVTNATATGVTITSGTTVGVSSLLSFYFTAGTYTLTTTASNLFNNLDFTGFAGTLANSIRSIYGNLTLSTGMTLSAGTSATTFASTTTGKTITSNGKTMDFPVTFNGAGGSWILQDAMTVGSARNTTLTNGTLDLNGFACTVGSFVTAAGTKNLTFNGSTLVVSGGFNNAVPTGFTTTAGTGTGVISMTSATGKSFTGNGSTYNCTLNQGGAGVLGVTGSNTFTNITNSVTPATVTFTANATNTFANFNLNGTAGNLVTINSTTPGVRTNIVKTGADVSCDYLNIQDSAAS